MRAPIEGLWRSIANSEPEQVIRNGTMKQLIAEGPHANGRLSVVSALGRIDTILSPLPSPVGGQWPSIGNWPMRASVLRLMEFVKDIPPITRIAFGATVISPVEDKIAGYRLIEQGAFDIQPKIPDEVSDFLLQFNCPVRSRRGPDGMTINRLARWGVAQVKLIWMQIGSSPPISREPTTREVMAARLELDFNTAAEWTNEIPRNQVTELAAELVELSEQYVEERLR